MATYTSVIRFIEPWSQNKELPFIRTDPEPGYDYMNFVRIDSLASLSPKLLIGSILCPLSLLTLNSL
jgi:hypothetical protein